MDGPRFDELAKRLAEKPPRRELLKGLLGTALAAAGLGALRHDATAAPLATLSPSSGVVRAKVTASLSGFKRLETFEIRWHTGNASRVVATGGVSRGGTRSITFSVPDAPRGTHAVRVVGNAGSVASASFRVAQGIALTKTRAARGESVKATLRGFKANVEVELRFFAGSSASSSLDVLASTTVSGSGTGTTTFSVPKTAALGNHRIEARETASGVLAGTTLNVVCKTAADCPGQDGECARRTCTNGACGLAYTAARTPVAQQTPGDCRKRVCDGAGAIVTVDDDTDLPAGDGQCLAGQCRQGAPSQTPAVAGAPCSQDGGSVCDGAGQCVVCLPGSTAPCYSGPPGTRDVGICSAGLMTCNDQGTGYGPCAGEVTPRAETTCNGLDDDCDGVIDGGVCGPVPNGTAGCRSGDCAIVACDTGFADCNGEYADGCETDTLTDASNCGSCGDVCAPGTTCAGGRCKQAQGTACAGDAECASGFCTDGYCCNVRCDGLCRSCEGSLWGGANGMCVDVPIGSDHYNECPGNGTCNGNGGCTA